MIREASIILEISFGLPASKTNFGFSLFLKKKSGWPHHVHVLLQELDNRLTLAQLGIREKHVEPLGLGGSWKFSDRKPILLYFVQESPFATARRAAA